MPQSQPTAYAPYPQPKKSHTAAIVAIAIIATLLLFVGAVLVLFVLPAYNGLQARTAVSSNILQFFDDAKRQDSQALASLLSSNATDGDKQFIIGIAQKAGSGCKPNNSSIAKQKTSPVSYTATATCSGGEAWKFTFVKDTKNGKWAISQLVRNSGGTASATTPTPVAATSACLTQAEASETGYDNSSVLGSFNPGTYIAGETIFFQPDSAEYTYPDQEIASMNKFGSWGAKYASKKWTMTLQGRVHETSLSSTGQQIAKQRADKVTAYLVSRGIPAQKIKTDIEVAPASGSSAESERNVGFIINGDPSCAPTK